MTVNIEELKALLGAELVEFALANIKHGETGENAIAADAAEVALLEKIAALIAAYEEREGLLRKLGELEAGMRQNASDDEQAGHASFARISVIYADELAAITQGEKK